MTKVRRSKEVTDRIIVETLLQMMDNMIEEIDRAVPRPPMWEARLKLIRATQKMTRMHFKARSKTQ